MAGGTAQYYPAIHQDFAGLVRAASFVLIRVCRAWRPRDTSFLRSNDLSRKNVALSLSLSLPACHRPRDETTKVVTRHQAADRKFQAERARPSIDTSLEEPLDAPYSRTRSRRFQLQIYTQMQPRTHCCSGKCIRFVWSRKEKIEKDRWRWACAFYLEIFKGNYYIRIFVENFCEYSGRIEKEKVYHF